MKPLEYPTDSFWTESIVQSFSTFGKDISHLSHEDILQKAKEVAEESEKTGITVNNGEAYLEIVYAVFGV